MTSRDEFETILSTLSKTVNVATQMTIGKSDSIIIIVKDGKIAMSTTLEQQAMMEVLFELIEKAPGNIKNINELCDCPNCKAKRSEEKDNVEIAADHVANIGTKLTRILVHYDKCKQIGKDFKYLETIPTDKELAAAWEENESLKSFVLELSDDIMGQLVDE